MRWASDYTNVLTRYNSYELLLNVAKSLSLKFAIDAAITTLK